MQAGPGEIEGFSLVGLRLCGLTGSSSAARFGAESGFVPEDARLTLTAAAMPAEETADEALMLAYQAGDAAAFDSLYQRHRAPLYRFLLRGCSNRAQAEDMFQDVWMNVIRASSNYQPSARFSTWLYRIAHNRLVDSYRQQKPTTEFDDELAETLADTQAGPEAVHGNRELAQRLTRAIAELPLEQRTAFLLQEERTLSLEEIATVTGVGRETVKSRLRYALQKLKGVLDES